MFCLLGKEWSTGVGWWVVTRVLGKKTKESKLENQGVEANRKMLKDDLQDPGCGGHSCSAGCISPIPSGRTIGVPPASLGRKWPTSVRVSITLS